MKLFLFNKIMLCNISEKIGANYNAMLVEISIDLNNMDKPS